MKTMIPLDRLRAGRFLAGLAIAASAFAVQADLGFRTTHIKVAGHELKVEVADNDPQREQGLMYRRQLGKNDGMLFVFDEPAYQAMWMKNTLIPLSVAFLDKNGEILNILDMEPQTLDTHMSAGPSTYAIETNKGWFAANKVKPGDKVTGLPRK